MQKIVVFVDTKGKLSLRKVGQTLPNGARPVGTFSQDSDIESLMESIDAIKAGDDSYQKDRAGWECALDYISRGLDPVGASQRLGIDITEEPRLAEEGRLAFVVLNSVLSTRAVSPEAAGKLFPLLGKSAQELLALELGIDDCESVKFNQFSRIV